MSLLLLGAGGAGSSIASLLSAWQQVRPNTYVGDYIGRDGAVMHFFGDVAYLFGGWSGPQSQWNNRNTTNEIWTTYDFGLTWTLARVHDEASTDRPSRRHTPGNCVATFGDTEYWYVIGGDIEDEIDYSGGHSDVWRTDNGLIWEKMAVHGTPGWHGRNILSAGFLNGKLYIVGGATGPGSTGGKDDMWESSDEGATWTLTTDALPFGNSMAAGEMVTLNNKLWLVAGGFLISCRNSVWTYDGTSWTEELANGHAQFTQKFYNNQVAYDGKVFTVCGENAAGVNLAETHWSSDGATWTSVGAGMPATHASANATHTDGVLFATGNSMSFSTWWLSIGGIPAGTDLVPDIVPDQLLLVENEPAHYTEAEWAGHSGYLKDYSVNYRSGDPIPGYAPSNCLTGNGSSYYATVAGAQTIGSWAGAIEIEFSFKTPATNATRTGIVSHGNASNWTYALTLEAGYQLGWRHDFTLLHTGTTVMSPSTWYRIKVVKTGSAGAWTVDFYINGTLDSSLSTANNAAIFSSPNTYLLRVPNTWHCAGSIADVRFSYDSKVFRIPCCEGVNANLSWIETVSGNKGVTSGALFSTSMWGTKTDHLSRCPNWILEYGGNLDGFGSLVPAWNGVACNAGTINLIASKFSQGTIHCDPTAVGDGSLGLESALTPSTERNTASSGKRRRRAQYGYVDRIAAKAMAMSNASSNAYFNDGT